PGRLLVPGQTIFRPFPGHQEVVAAEILRKRDRLIDDALLAFRIAKLDMAGEREVLALRISFEAVVGENPPQVLVAAEGDAVHVAHFALETTRHGPQARDAWHRGRLVGRDLDDDPPVPGQRQQAITDVEALRALRVIDPGDLHQLLIFE